MEKQTNRKQTERKMLYFWITMLDYMCASATSTQNSTNHIKMNPMQQQFNTMSWIGFY